MRTLLLTNIYFKPYRHQHSTYQLLSNFYKIVNYTLQTDRQTDCVQYTIILNMNIRSQYWILQNLVWLTAMNLRLYIYYQKPLLYLPVALPPAHICKQAIIRNYTFDVWNCKFSIHINFYIYSSCFDLYLIEFSSMNFCLFIWLHIWCGTGVYKCNAYYLLSQRSYYIYFVFCCKARIYGVRFIFYLYFCTVSRTRFFSCNSVN